MCVAIPGKIIEVCGNEAIADFKGINRKVNIMLIEDAKPGDYILVHVGCAIEKLNKKEAEETLELFEEMLKEDV